MTGFEPAVSCLGSRRAATAPHPHCRAFSDTSHGGDVLSASRKRMAGFRVNVRGLHAGWGLDTCFRQRSSTPLASGHGCVDSAVRHCRPYCLIYSSQVGYMGSDIPMRVGLTGFEPATPCSQSTCATKLRHNPIFLTGLRGLPATYVPY